MKQRIYSYFLSIVLLVGFLLPALEVRADDPAATVTFTNEPDKRPYLEIQKVLEIDANTEIPADKRDETFQFYVQVEDEEGNLKTYSNQAYTITDANGDIVKDEKNKSDTWNTTIKDESGNVIADGMVVLKAGQTAKFDYVGTNKKYRIEEIELSESYKCMSPASGVVTGTVGPTGATEIFKNRYVSLLDAEDGALTVEKVVSYPAGYEYTGEEEFGFTLYLDKKPAKSETYILRNLETGEDASGIKTTGENGHFTLKAGEAAVFSELPEADYKVVEDPCPTGWHRVDVESHEGTTKAHATETFINTNTSFTVTKKLEDWKDDTTEFTFELHDGTGTAWRDAEYMLYSTGGKRINRDVSGNDVSGNDIVYQTGEDGSFKLKANEAAVFTGIAPGTGYSVKEVAPGNVGYLQKTPSDVDGYKNKVVEKEGTEILPFVNGRLERKGSLTVTKTLSYKTGEAPLTGAEQEFKFRIYQIDGTKEENLVNVVYMVGNERAQTNPEGCFTLKRDETAIFNWESGLSFGKEYGVTEIELDQKPGYSIAEEKATMKGTLQENEMLSLSFENEYTARHFDLDIQKVDGNKKLQDAKFVLYMDEECKVPYVAKDENKDTAASGSGDEDTVKTTSVEGLAGFKGLREGTYYLKEVEAPRGYQMMMEPVVLTVKRVADDKGNEILQVERADTDDAVIDIEWSKDSLEAADDPTTGHDKLTITIKNDRGKLYNLPATGGPGTAGFAVIGIILMAAAAALVIRSRKKTA